MMKANTCLLIFQEVSLALPNLAFPHQISNQLVISCFGSPFSLRRLNLKDPSSTGLVTSKAARLLLCRPFVRSLLTSGGPSLLL